MLRFSPKGSSRSMTNLAGVKAQNLILVYISSVSIVIRARKNSGLLEEATRSLKNLPARFNEIRMGGFDSGDV